MKTLKELNSKWYWRLSKVVYFFILIIVLVASMGGYYYEFTAHDPKDISKISKDIESIYKTFDDIEKEVLELNWNYSSGSIWSTSSWWFINGWLISEILSKGINSKIEWITVICKNLTKDECDTSWMTTNTYRNYIQTWEPLKFPEYDIYEYKNAKEEVFWLKAILDESKESSYKYNLISSYNKSFNGNIDTDRDYRWFTEYLKMILSFLATFIWAILFTFIVKSLVYYIILWLAFPKE